MSDNAEVIKAYKKVLAAIESLTSEQQERVMEATSKLLGYTRKE